MTIPKHRLLTNRRSWKDKDHYNLLNCSVYVDTTVKPFLNEGMHIVETEYIFGFKIAQL